MKKNLTLSIFVALAVLFSACENKKEASSVTLTALSNDVQKWDNNAIETFIKRDIETRNTTFDWQNAPVEMLWSALVATDSMLAVGYTEGSKAAVLQLIIENEQRYRPELDWSKCTVGSDFDNLNAFYIKVSGIETLQKLRASSNIRYIYPTGYSPDAQATMPRSDSGCDGYNAEALTANVHYTNITPGAKASWHHLSHQVNNAWNYATGQGIKMMVIDAGLSQNQSAFQAASFDPFGTGRTLELISRYPASINFWGTSVNSYTTSPYTTCGHGTAMSGLAVAPRNAVGNAVGVAYNCNFVFCRATQDVLIGDSYEELGVAAALNLAASRSDIRVVSMSLGSIISRRVIGDAIIAVRNGGKLPFCAAGTSTTWTSWYGVIYPANMAEAIAVTGVTTNTAQKCGVCHSGSEVDFTAVMERSSDGVKAVTTAVSGNAPSTVGGSSAATATVAGIATLVWSRKPSMTAAQIYTRLRNAAANGASPSSSLGFGVINAASAANY